MKIATLFLLILILLFTSTLASACGPFFPDSVITEGDEVRVLNLPSLDFDDELIKLTGVQIDTAGYCSSEQVQLDAALHDLALALAESSTTPTAKAASDTSETLEQYELLRQVMQDWSEHLTTFTQVGGWQPLPFYQNRLTTATHPVAHFDFTEYEPLLATISKEFVLYSRGAAAWHGFDEPKAVEYWKELLNLPKEERHYRTVWAMFMIGKTCIAKEPAKAVEWFEKTRQAASAGFADSINLSRESLGWQAMAERRMDKPVEALKHYFEMLKCSTQTTGCFDAVNSISYMMQERPKGTSKLLDPRFALDPITRSIVTLWIVSHPQQSPMNPTRPERNERLGTWLSIVKQSGQKITAKEAELLAGPAYVAGDMRRAKEYLAQAKELTPYAKWIKAKICVYEGKVDEGLQILSELRDAFPVEGNEPSQEDNPESQTLEVIFFWWQDYCMMKPAGLGRQLQVERGTLLLGRGAYLESLDCFLQAGFQWDANYVAERVLTTDELADYIEKHSRDSYLNRVYVSDNPDYQIPPISQLRSILSRRYARMGKFDLAARYASEQSLPALKEYTAELLSGRDVSLSLRKRAEHLMKAARISRKDGLSILGTILEPDWAALDAQFHLWNRAAIYSENRDMGVAPSRITQRDPYDPNRDPYARITPALRAVLSAGPREKARFNASKSNPYRFLHYRYTASNLMWEAAKLLPDNDPLTAEALYKGGTYLQYRDKQAADHFYKTLVRRCRKLPIGQQADKEKWFPQEDQKQ